MEPNQAEDNAKQGIGEGERQAHELDTALCPDGAAVDGRLLQQCQQLLSTPRAADPGAAERFARALGIPLGHDEQLLEAAAGDACGEGDSL